MPRRFFLRARLAWLVWRARRQELREAVLRSFGRMWDGSVRTLGPDGAFVNVRVLVRFAVQMAVEEVWPPPPSAGRPRRRGRPEGEGGRARGG